MRTLSPVEKGERRSQSDVSRLIADMWLHEPNESRAVYERLADVKKAEHAAKYPGYRFQPMKKEEKIALRERRKAEKEAERKARQRKRGKRSQEPATAAVAPPASQAPVPQITPTPPLPSFFLGQQLPLYPPMHAGVLHYPVPLFGAAGPSPPASVASSPPPSPSPETTPEPSSDESQFSQPVTGLSTPSILYTATALPPDLNMAQQATANVSPGANPYLALLGPNNRQFMYQPPPLNLPSVVPPYPMPPTPVTPQQFALPEPASDEQVQVVQNADRSMGSDTGQPQQEDDPTQTSPTNHLFNDYNFQSGQYEQGSHDDLVSPPSVPEH